MFKKLAYSTLIGVALTAVTAVQAQTAFPAKAIRIVVPFAAGGTSDILARTIGQKLTESWGQPVVVDNRAGANGNVGADHVAKSAPDGYTLLVVKDFSPVGMVSYSPHAFGVHPSVPVNNVKELIDYAKANPGKLNFAISGTGGAPHLAGIAFAQRTGIKWAYIPYKGGSQAVADVASGQANVIMNGMLATYPTMKSGRIRALAISSAQRVSSAPEVPTIAETLPGFETGSYQGLLAPAGTPRDVVSKLNAEIAKILATPEMREKLAVLGTEVRTAQPEALGTFIAAEKPRWAQVIKESGIKFD